ncbi:MAG: hypothetical protein IKT58_06465 [Oscillospiraceae bacterium]|nr:hypothetical protein [Oscillospiraceae bacterium]
MKLLHLYDDLMNLYGEYANLLVLERELSKLGQAVEIHCLRLGEQKDISGYDLYYMGAGTERKQKLALAELKKYAPVLKQAKEEGKVILFTGNAFSLLGKTIVDAKGQTYEGLGLFPFQSVEGSRRILGDCYGHCSLFSEPLVGFMNKCSKITGITTPLFTLDMGFGNDRDKGPEGIVDGNCFGTHLAGPILTKNPAMLKLILQRLPGDLKPKMDDPYMQQAYETTANALKEQLAGK